MKNNTVIENKDNELKCPDCLVSHCKHCKCVICEEQISLTCCNIEVSEPKGTEVMCKCGEWVITK